MVAPVSKTMVAPLSSVQPSWGAVIPTHGRQRRRIPNPHRAPTRGALPSAAVGAVAASGLQRWRLVVDMTGSNGRAQTQQEKRRGCKCYKDVVHSLRSSARSTAGQTIHATPSRRRAVIAPIPQADAHSRANPFSAARVSPRPPLLSLFIIS